MCKQISKRSQTVGRFQKKKKRPPKFGKKQIRKYNRRATKPPQQPKKFRADSELFFSSTSLIGACGASPEPSNGPSAAARAVSPPPPPPPPPTSSFGRANPASERREVEAAGIPRVGERRDAVAAARVPDGDVFGARGAGEDGGGGVRDRGRRCLLPCRRRRGRRPQESAVREGAVLRSLLGAAERAVEAEDVGAGGGAHGRGGPGAGSRRGRRAVQEEGRQEERGVRGRGKPAEVSPGALPRGSDHWAEVVGEERQGDEEALGRVRR